MFWRKKNELEWSSSPGPREMHLKRRHNNPLFEKDRQIVNSEELTKAISSDLIHHESLKQDLSNLLSKSSAIIKEMNSSSGWEKFEIMRRDTWKVIDQAAEMGSIAELELETSIGLMRALLSSGKNSVKDHPVLSSRMDEAVGISEKTLDTVQYSLYRQITSEWKYIPDDEVLPSILSEPIESMAAIMNKMGEKGCLLVAKSGMQALHDMNDKETTMVLDYDKKLALFLKLIS